MVTRNVLISVILTMTLIGCTKVQVEHVEKITAAAWSDDGNKVLYSKVEYDEIKEVMFFGGTGEVKTDNEARTLYLSDKEMSSSEYLTDFYGISSWEVDTSKLHFKSEMGYVVTRSGSSGAYQKGVDGPIHTSGVDYRIYDLNGNTLYRISKEKDSYCENFSTVIPSIKAFPSPDGSKIAVAESMKTCELDIKVLDFENDFEVVHRTKVEGAGISGMFWLDEQNLFINSCSSYGCSDEWYLVRADENTYVNDDQFASLCLGGAIVNSDINKDFEKLHIVSDDKIEIYETDDFSSTGFHMYGGPNTRRPDSPEGCVSVNDFFGESKISFTDN